MSLKLKILTMLSGLSTIIATSTLLTSCSSSSNPFENLYYGNDVSCKKKECEELILTAKKHIEQYYPQQEMDQSDASALIQTNPITLQLAYWEFLIYLGGLNTDISLTDWSATQSSEIVNVTLNATWDSYSITSENALTFEYMIDTNSSNHIQVTIKDNSEDFLQFDSYKYFAITIV